MRALAMFGLLLAAPALLAAAPPRAAPQSRPAVQDWSATVTRTPMGAYVMGNPHAKVRVVEFASLTCSHCAAFAAEAYPALRRDYLRRGLVSLELRHAVRDRADLAASLLARCAGPRGYFPMVERIFAAQDKWLPAAAASDTGDTPETPARQQAALLATAADAGLPAVAGLSAPAAAACIGNRAEQAVLGKMSSDAWGVQKISGTPAFLINDRVVEGASWATLAPQIAAALR